MASVRKPARAKFAAHEVLARLAGAVAGRDDQRRERAGAGRHVDVVRDSLRETVRDSVRDAVRDNLAEPVKRGSYGLLASGSSLFSTVARSASRVIEDGT